MDELFWLILAYACGLIAQQCRLPVFVGYLLAGWLIGFGGHEVTPLLEQASTLGVLFLLFTVGLHIHVGTLLRREVWAGGSLHLAISTSIFLLTCLSFGLEWGPAIYLGVLLSLSSTVIAAKDLEERDELGSAHGRVAIGILILQDLVAVLLLATTGGGHFDPLLLALLPLALLARPLFRVLAERTRVPDLLVLYCAALVLGLAAWFHNAGTSAELGALVAGAILAGHRRADELAERIWSIKEILLVAFFLKVGMLGLPSLEALYWAALILLVLPFKAVLFFCLLALLGMPRRSAFITGATLTSYSEFTLVGGLAAHSAGLLTADYLGVLALATVLSFAINLPLNRLVLALYNRVAFLLDRVEEVGPAPAPPGFPPGPSAHLVIGLGRTGDAAYRLLRERNLPVVGMDIDPLLAAHLTGAGWRVICADARDPAFWQQPLLPELESAVVALPSLSARASAVAGVRMAAPGARISVFALDADETATLKKAGADDVTLLLEDAGARLAELATGDR